MTAFGTSAFKGWTAKQVAGKYAEVRAFVMALPNCKFRDAAHFDGFVAGFNTETGLRGAKHVLLSAFDQVSVHMTVTTFSPPSEETLAWGGFLSGSVSHNSAAADAACAQLLAT